MFKYVSMVLGAILMWALFILWMNEKEISSLTLENQQLAIELDVSEGNLATAEISNKLQSDQVAAFQQQIIKISAEREESRKQVEYVRNLFMGHDFRRLLEKKPGLIEKRMIKATAKVLQELEDATK